MYTCFVCVSTRLPLLIIGKPGSSKTLSLRILVKNLGKRDDEYLKKFKAIRNFTIPGSENTVSSDIKTGF
jgi:E3 ubiquitin-protein ligase RNF213